MHVRGMCRLALVALARLESGQAKLRKTSKGPQKSNLKLTIAKLEQHYKHPTILGNHALMLGQCPWRPYRLASGGLASHTASPI